MPMIEFTGIFQQQDAGAVSAYPTLVSFTETEFAIDATGHSVNMPATVASGNLILLLWTNDSSDTLTSPSPGTWTNIYNTMGGSSARGALWVKTAAGTEGGTTVDVVTSGAESASAQVFVFSNWSGNLANIQAATQSYTATAQAFDCPSLTPSYGAAPSYWLATLHGSTGNTINSPPPNYTDAVWTRGDPTSTGGQVGSARRAELNVTSEDPGEWVTSASTTADFLTGTVAIKGV